MNPRSQDLLNELAILREQRREKNFSSLKDNVFLIITSDASIFNTSLPAYKLVFNIASFEFFILSGTFWVNISYHSMPCLVRVAIILVSTLNYLLLTFTISLYSYSVTVHEKWDWRPLQLFVIRSTFFGKDPETYSGR